VDLEAIIRDLQAEKRRLDQSIAAMESLMTSNHIRRRGRKSMGPAERAEVSKRMKGYWASRRVKTA